MQKLILLLTASVGAIQTLWAKEKPNFLVIVTDDQTFESISALNSKEVKTPNIDRLVKNGTTFTHAFNQGSWSGAVSVASRTMLITGQNVMNAQKNSTYMAGWARTVPVGKEIKAKLWGETMGEAGYETFITGKWHNTDEPLLRSFQRGEAIAEGFYETTDEDGKFDFAYTRPNNSCWTPWNKNYKGHWSPVVRDIISKDGTTCVWKRYQKDQHTSELFADKAIGFIQNDHKQPFFMYVAFNAPHDPRQSPKEFVDMYPRERIKIPVNFQPEHPFDLGIRKERDELLAPYPRTKEAVQLHRQEYYAIITHFDRELGRILDALETSGQAENTCIVFTSDHGLAVGMHGLMGKQNLYDHSVRMPLIIVGPGIRKNVRIDEKVYMQSLYATTCELAGVPVPQSVDFKSLYPLLQGEKNRGEAYIFGYFKNLQRMIRSDRYKLIVYPKVNQIQLFDLKKDPYETVNLAGKAKYEKIQQELLNELKRKQQELGDTLRIAG